MAYATVTELQQYAKISNDVDNSLLQSLITSAVAYIDEFVGFSFEAAADSTIVYVMRHRSLLDYLFFNYLFVRKRLPLAKYANEINMLPILPWGLGMRTMLAKLTFFLRHGWLPNPVDSGWLKDQVANGRPVLLFLQRRQTFLERLRRKPPSGGVAEELIRAQRDIAVLHQ